MDSKDHIYIFSYKLNKNVNINEIIESLMFFSLKETIQIYGDKETYYVYNTPTYQKNYMFQSLNVDNDYSIKIIDERDDDDVFL